MFPLILIFSLINFQMEKPLAWTTTCTEAHSWRAKSCPIDSEILVTKVVEGEQCQDIGARNMALELKVRVGILVILRGDADCGRRCRWTKIGELEDSGWSG